MKENSKCFQLLRADVFIGAVSLVDSSSLCDCVSQPIVGQTSKLRQNNWTLQILISLSVICKDSLQRLAQMSSSTFSISKITLDESYPVSLRKELTGLSHILWVSEKSWLTCPTHIQPSEYIWKSVRARVTDRGTC